MWKIKSSRRPAAATRWFFAGNLFLVSCQAQLVPNPEQLTTAQPILISNLHDKQIVETSVVFGTSTAALPVTCQFDGGSAQTAAGTTAWRCPLPIGGATWRLGSKHTIVIQQIQGDASTASRSIGVVAGNNKDIDGDGYPDWVGGAAGDNGGLGSVNVYPGSATGIAPTPSVSIPGPASSDNFGGALAVGDVNGDGFADVAVADDYFNSYKGAVYVYLGKSTGLNPAPASTYLGTVANAQLGTSVAIGDANGDGFGDLIVAAPFGGTTGVVSVYNGSAMGLSGSVSYSRSLSNKLGFGNSLTVGEINADGYADLLVGGSTLATLYSGGAQGLTSTSLNLPGPYNASNFGSGAAFGDINADGYADLLIADEDYNNGLGSIFGYLGSAHGVSTTIDFVLTGFDYAHFGGSFSLGDVNGDGYPDLAVGGVRSSNSQGVVYVFEGTVDGFTYVPQTTLSYSPSTAADYFGGAVVLRDLNADGFSDLIVGSQYTNSGGTVSLYLATSEGIPTTPTNLWLGPTNAYFGGALGINEMRSRERLAWRRDYEARG